MKAYGHNFIFCAIIAFMQVSFEALSGEPIEKDGGQKILMSQQEQFQPPLHPSMSCYVCSTTDYENPADNLCKVMKYQHRSPGLHQVQGPGVGHHATSMMNYPSPATTTTTTTTTTSTTSMPGTSMSMLDEDATQSLTKRHNNDPSGSGITGSPGQQPQAAPHTNSSASLVEHYNDTRSVSKYNNSNVTMLHQSTSMMPAYQGYYSQPLQHRQSPGNFIRSRPCLEDENFCSIVSVVRIEFVNDNLVSRFWAMERNCSKSCNTGCMLIGERVRLRVCSQCCRTPNCNSGSGAASTILEAMNPIQFTVVLLTALISIRQLIDS